VPSPCEAVSKSLTMTKPAWSPPSSWSSHSDVKNVNHQRRRQEFSFRGYGPGNLEDGSPPVGSRGFAPVGILETQSHRSWSSLQIYFDCRNDQNLKILHNLPPDSRPACFTVGG